MTWQDAGVVLIVGSAIAYVIRKFLLPQKRSAKATTFIPLQQLKSRSKAKPGSR